LKALLFEMSAAPGLGDTLCRRLGCDRGEIEWRQFPDGESYVRLASRVSGRDVMLLCSLDRPDPKALSLLFAAAAARAQGARSVGLIAPYLSYMRQDKAFQLGEAVTSVTFAELLSSHVDWLATVDPHLHRYRRLGEIYLVPTAVATAADAIGEWVAANVPHPVIVGPDEESRQWAQRIAAAASAPVTVLQKSRSGDTSVSIDDSGLAHLESGTPVVVDDIASTARTMIEAVKLLKRHGRDAPVCAVVHPIFVGDSYRLLLELPATIVSTNTIVHDSNAIDISEPVAEAVATVLSALRSRSGSPAR
jgi:ribose-phosphate pyrophosphokinase